MGQKKAMGIPLKPNLSKELADITAYASIYLILNNKRYTLALKYVKKGETLKDTVNFLINEIETNGFKIKGLYP